MVLYRQQNNNIKELDKMTTNHHQYVNSFKEYLINDKSASPNTIKSYIFNLEQYFSFFPDNPVISRANIKEYKKKLSHLSPATINQKMSTLKSFNEYLLENNLIDSILIVKNDFIKIQSRGNPTTVTNKQIAKFFNKVLTKPCVYQSRNIALIFLMAHTGIRREEVCNLKLSGIDLENNEITLCGKGGKVRTVILEDKQTIEYIKQYLRDRANHKNAASEYLFLSERGDHLTKETINDIFNFYCTPKNKITPHSLRHNFATTAIEQGIYDITQLRDQLGHASISTTQIYTHPRKDVMKKKARLLKIG